MEIDVLTSNRAAVEAMIKADWGIEITDTFNNAESDPRELKQVGSVINVPLQKENGNIISNKSLNTNARIITTYSLDESDFRSCVNNLITWLKCKYCPAVFPNLALLNQHWYIHAKHEGITCDLCCLKVKCASEFRKHRLTHLGKMPYLCRMCNKSFLSIAGVAKHRMSHNPDTPNLIYGYIGNHRTYSKNVRIKYDFDSKPFTCIVCRKSFHKISDHNAHIKIHSGSPFSCIHCGRKFNHIGNLVRHELVHKGTGIYKCTVCNCRFNYNSSLTSHIVRVHLDNEKEIKRPVLS